MHVWGRGKRTKPFKPRHSLKPFAGSTTNCTADGQTYTERIKKQSGWWQTFDAVPSGCGSHTVEGRRTAPRRHRSPPCGRRLTGNRPRRLTVGPASSYSISSRSGLPPSIWSAWRHSRNTFSPLLPCTPWHSAMNAKRRRHPQRPCFFPQAHRLLFRPDEVNRSSDQRIREGHGPDFQAPARLCGLPHGTGSRRSSRLLSTPPVLEYANRLTVRDLN